MPITDPQFIAALNSQDGGSLHPIVLFEVDHPDFPEPLRWCKYNEPVVHNGDQYSPVVLRGGSVPSSIPGEVPTMNIALGDLSQTTLNALLAIDGRAEKPTCTISIIHSGDPDTVQAGPYVGACQGADSGPNGEVSLRVTLHDALSEPFLIHRFTPSNNPNLFFRVTE